MIRNGCGFSLTGQSLPRHEEREKHSLDIPARALSWRGSAGVPQNVTWLPMKGHRLGNVGNGHNDTVITAGTHRSVENHGPTERHREPKPRWLTHRRFETVQRHCERQRTTGCRPRSDVTIGGRDTHNRITRTYNRLTELLASCRNSFHAALR